MKSVSCSQPPLWNDRLLFLRFNPSSFVSIFFPKDCISVNSNAAAWGFVGLVFFRENLEPCSSTGSWMPAATQPQPSQASLKTLRSLHWHCWATQCLTLGMYLNSSWNCLPSKLRKTGAELQDMARISQNLASWVGKWRMFHLQPGETLVTPELWKTDQGYCRNALSWQKPVPVLQSGICMSPTPTGISTRTSKLQEGSGLRRDFIWARLHSTHTDTQSKPTCTIQVTWGRSSPRAATSFKINKEITSVKILWRYQHSEESSGMVTIESNWLWK